MAGVQQNDDSQMEGTITLGKCGPCGRIWPVFLPDSKAHTSWEIFGLLLIIYELITLPYKLVFEVTGGPALQKFDYVSMSFFLTDIVKNFNLCYYEQGLLVTQPSRIIKTYLKGWFLIDLVASLPFQLMFGGGDGMASTKMLRIVRLARFLKILRLLKVAKVKKLLRRLEETTDTFFILSFMLRMFKVILWLILLSHFSACGWYLVGKISTPDCPDCDGPKNWIEKISPPVDDYEDITFMLYLNALYLSLATMTTVGYGDLSPVNTDEKLFGIIFFLLSIVAFSGVVGSVGEVLHAFQNASAGKRSQLSELKQYMRWRKIPSKVQQKLRHFLTYSLEHCDAELAEQEETILKQLSPALQQQVCSFVYSGSFKTLSCLNWLFEDRRKLPVDTLLTYVRTELHGPGDIIFIAGQQADKVYSVVEGIIVIVKQAKSDVAAMHSNEYIKLLEYRQKCLMLDFESGIANPSDDIYLIKGCEQDPRHMGHEALLELLYDTPQTRVCSAISHDHVQAHSFKIEDLVSVLHTFPWLWENCRHQLSADTYLQQWTEANNQDGTLEYEQLVDETCEDNLQDGMADGDDMNATQLPDHDQIAEEDEDVDEDEKQKRSIKHQMDQLLDQYRRLQVEQKELEATGAIIKFDTAAANDSGKWAVKSVLKHAKSTLGSARGSIL